MRFSSPISRRARRPAARPTMRRRALSALTTASLIVTAACGGSEGGNATGTGGPSAPTTGSLAVTINGLPSGTAAGVTITNGAGFSRAVSATTTIASLAPGAYDVVAAQVTTGQDRFDAAPASQPITVTAGATATATVGYGIVTGSLAISVSGLPTGQVPNVLVTGPNGYARTVSAATTLGGLTPGAYRLAPVPVVVDNSTYAPVAPTLDVAVAASSTPTAAPLPYQLASASLVVAIAGLPNGTSGSATVTGPDGARRTVNAGEMLSNLPPGSYTIAGDPVTVGVDGYRVAAPVTVALAASVTPVSASLTYVLATGRLTVAVSGLPLASNANITVTGPGAYSHPVSATQTLVGLAPGDYTITATSVTAGNLSYGSVPASQVITVDPGTTPAQATVTYAATTGSLTVSVAGLPQAVPAAITVTGPGNYSSLVTTTSTLTNLAPGTYTLTAANAVTGTHTYAPTPTSRTVTVTAGTSAATASFAYALASGGMAVTVSGLPLNVLADISISGPNGYARTLNATTLLLGLTPGSYTMTARGVSSGGASWAPNPASQSVNVAASTSAVAATVNYVTAMGSLIVTVNGLPGGIGANVTVTGPNGYSRTLSASTTIGNLVQGTYTVAASTVTSGGTTYTASPASSNVSVGGGATSSATVTYTASGGPPPATLNLTIDRLHVQQAVQTYDGGVPIVAGRDGLLRVFVKANAGNSAAPTVRVRFYSGATLTSTISIGAPTASVPQAITEGMLTSSWNYTIPGSMLQPGLRILADVDPANAIAESSDSDNSYPASGTPLAMDVRTVPTFNVRLVPVLQSANGKQGGVTSGNANQYLADTRQLLPLNTVDADVRAPFTTNAPVLQDDDGNGAWSQILSEINALRTADGSARYYYGVLKVGYTSGIAGLGYVPGRAAIGWDYLPSATEVMAHEVGHNFGRLHAPGCGAGGPDPSYPYASGKIGAYGYDITQNRLMAPTAWYDLMGYCDSTWVSDYTYTGVLDYRAANPFSVGGATAGNSAQRGLLVWGRVQDGQVILEPTFDVVAPPSLPRRPGRNRLQGFGAMGEVLFDLPFDAERVADRPNGSAEHFAFVIPYGMMRGQQPTRVRVASGAQQAEFRSIASSPTASETPVVERAGARALRVRWNNAETRGVLVRHPTTGEILAFARGGDAIVYTSESSLDLTISDGVRSARQRVTVGAGGAPPQR